MLLRPVFTQENTSMGSDRIGTKLKPRMGFRYQFSVPVLTYDPMIKSWSIFNFFCLAVWIIQDGKESSPIRSDAYFPEWKPALNLPTGVNSGTELLTLARGLRPEQLT